MSRKFTIEEFKNYLISSDSFGDAVYYLSEESVEKANTIETKFCDGCGKYVDPVQVDEDIFKCPDEDCQEVNYY